MDEVVEKSAAKMSKKTIIAALICAILLIAAFAVVWFSADDIMRTLGMVALATVAAALVVGFAVAFALRRRTRAQRIGATAVLAFIGAATAFSLGVYALAPSLLFYPHFDEDSFAELQTRPAAEQIEVDTEAGHLSGWLLHNAEDGAPLVIYFYGNGQNAAPVLVGFQDNGRLDAFAGYNIAVFDYPGYGHTEGSPSEDSLKSFGLAVYDALAMREDVDPDRVVVFGYSIGTGVASFVASERDVDGLVLMAPYADGYDLYNSLLDIFHGPLRALVAFPMESARFARDADVAALVLASKDDGTVPYESSARLAEALPDCTFETFTGFDHNEFWASSDVREAVTAFLAKVAAE